MSPLPPSRINKKLPNNKRVTKSEKIKTHVPTPFPLSRIVKRKVKKKPCTLSP